MYRHRRSVRIPSSLTAAASFVMLAQLLSTVPATARTTTATPEAPPEVPVPELPPVDRRLVPAPGGEYGEFDPIPVSLPSVANPPVAGRGESLESASVTSSSTNSPPPAAQLLSPADGATLENGSPTLKIQKPVTDPDGDRVYMNYQVSTANNFGSNTVAESGWSERDYSWYVPSGKLKDGTTYWWRVQTSDLACIPGSACGPNDIVRVNSTKRNFNLVLHKWGSDPRWAMWKTGLGNGIGLEVNQANGNLFLDYPLDSLATEAGPLDLRLQYNSQQTEAIDFGDGWSLSAGPGNDPGPVPTDLVELGTGDVRIKLSDGDRLYFPHLTGNQYASVGGGAGVVTRSDEAPRWRFRTPSGSEYSFTADGKLKSAVAATGDFSAPGFSYTYNASSRLIQVSDPVDRAITIAWDSGHPSGITTWDGRSWALTAGGADRITSVTDPTAAVVGFGYNGAGNLESVTDGEGHTTTIGYPTSLRGQQQVGSVQLPGIAFPTTFTYGTVLNGEIVQRTNVTDPRGVATSADSTDFMTATHFNVAGFPIRIEEPKTPEPSSIDVTLQLWDENLNLVCRRTPEANRLGTGCANADNPLSLDGRQTDYEYQNRSPHLLKKETSSKPDQPTGDNTRLVTSYGYDQGFDELYVEYFNNQALAGRPASAEFQAGVDRDYDANPPSSVNLANLWSLRMTGILEVPDPPSQSDNRYVFKVVTAAQDGVRLYVGNKEIFDCWESSDPSVCGEQQGEASYRFPAGNKSLILEFRDRGGPASLTVKWKHEADAGFHTIAATETQPEVNLLTRVTDPAGATTNSYTATDKPLRRLSSQTRGGRTTSYGYDPSGRVVSETDPRGKVTQYTYTGACLTRELDRTGAELLHVCNGAGDFIETTRKIRGGVAQQPLQDRVTKTTYDELGRVETVSERINGVFEQTLTNQYNNAGRLVRTTDAIGAVTDYLYDPAGRLIQETLPDPDRDGPKPRPVITHGYDLVGNETSTTDARGKVWTRTFDSHNRIASESDPFCSINGPTHLTCSTTTTEYDTTARTVTVTDPAEVATVTSHDLLGRVVSRKVNALTLSRYEYNSNGQLLKRLEAPAPEFTYTYNSFGQVLTETRPDAVGQTATTTYTYDAGGRLERVKDPRGLDTVYGYDDEGRLTSVQLPIPAPNNTTYVYDDAGELVRVRDATGRERDVKFDERGRQVEAIDARGTTRYGYDAASRLTRTELPTGVTQIFEYDALGRRTRRYGTELPLPLPPLPLPPGDVRDDESFEYDEAGNLVQAVNAEGPVALAYDHAGRLSTVTAEGQPTTYAYEKNRLKSRTDAAGVTSFAYNDDGQLEEITDPFGTRALYEYDDLGRVEERRFGPAQQIATAWTYDAASRVDTQTTGGVSIDLGYDKASNVTSKTVAGPFAPGESGTWNYAYDPASRLESAQDSAGVTTTYAYDGAGNRTSVKVGNADPVTTSYDAAGHPDSSSDGTDYTTDATGALTEVRTGGLPPPLGEVTSYEYDTWGRLGEVTDPDGLPTTYSYDAFDRTIGRTDALGTATYHYAGDSHDMVFEQVTLAGAGGTTSRKVALSPEGPLAIRSTDALGATVTRYPLADPHGDVIALFSGPGGPTGTRTYSPWGEVRSATGDASVSPFGFQGDWTDPGTGQVDMGARMYEPKLGRFTTMDPLFGQTTNPLSLNRFTYVSGNPVTSNDPTGLCEPRQCEAWVESQEDRDYPEATVEYEPRPNVSPIVDPQLRRSAFDGLTRGQFIKYVEHTVQEYEEKPEGLGILGLIAFIIDNVNLARRASKFFTKLAGELSEEAKLLLSKKFAGEVSIDEIVDFSIKGVLEAAAAQHDWKAGDLVTVSEWVLWRAGEGYGSGPNFPHYRAKVSIYRDDEYVDGWILHDSARFAGQEGANLPWTLLPGEEWRSPS